MRKTLFGSLLVLLAAPVAAQKVYVDYDGATAFSQLRTFQVVETRKDFHERYPLLHKRVLEQLRTYAREGALSEVESDPDVYIAYYTALDSDLRLALDELDYSYGPGFAPGTYWDGGVGTRTPYSYTFKEGTLIIDVWEAESQRLIWRGMATSALSNDPEKNVKKVEKALEKMMKTWEKDYGGHVRRLRVYQQQQQQ